MKEAGDGDVRLPTRRKGIFRRLSDKILVDDATLIPKDWSSNVVSLYENEV